MLLWSDAKTKLDILHVVLRPCPSPKFESAQMYKFMFPERILHLHFGIKEGEGTSKDWAEDEKNLYLVPF